ncbi:hypothetical protein ACOMICROBIO_LMKGKHOH_03948 [Vibrio sp. B1FIG11]|uniref:beta/gamma crystallin-related protein n=1 Tax=Vibrio sp. B1FIG11 TaxID=2751177 RepID=UPI001AFC7F67|nr:beta/gamma crystallin-related protein [Vibrio sp. B1FIG11]CAD7826929.1 hypothetical protein ACOMICROBIO_LMKGKHOH_03948 [Vibrio sp. B1FIG11]CAE6962190.1 hypothetical protein ACOMICROBIO_LMKGKHOH_03948 [Vibrio sp. B1FIG11]
MKKSILAMVLMSCSFASLAQSYYMSYAYIELHQDAHEEGRSLRVNTAQPDLRDFDFNDITSSVTIPDGYMVQVFKDVNYQGESLVLRDSDDWLEGFNDQISSLIIYPSDALILENRN